MLKISDIPLKQKLVGSFLLVSLATVVIGFFGRYAASTLGDSLQKATGESLPAIETMADMRDLAGQFVLAQQGLLNAYLSQEILQDEYAKLDVVRSEYAKRMKAFQAFPRSTAVDTAWQAYTRAFGDWLGENDIFFAKLKELEATGILNPLQLHADTLKAKGAFDAAITRMGGRIYSLEEADGTDWGVIAVSLSSWGTLYPLTNPVIEEELMSIEMEASSLERYLKQMDSLIERGFRSQAGGVYQQEMLPVQASISEAFSRIGVEVDKAVDINRE
uniref:MCP four helix bundle domain-containing protein n=1 Tax=Desulfoluna sp. TaxID=2045199 RepID=UPI00260D049C